MHTLLSALFTLLRAVVMPRATLMLENAALRQQLTVYQRDAKRPRLRPGDRVFWVALRRLWTAWPRDLVPVQPATVIGWHRKGFTTLWRKCAIHHSGSTIRQDMVPHRRPPRGGQAWRTFVRNHAAELWACDFLTEHTATFTVAYVFVIMEIASRRIVHVNVTTAPTLAWVTQQLRDATPWGTTPRFLVHDNDAIYGRYRPPVTTSPPHDAASHLPVSARVASRLTSVVSFRGLRVGGSSGRRPSQQAKQGDQLGGRRMQVEVARHALAAGRPQAPGTPLDRRRATLLNHETT